MGILSTVDEWGQYPNHTLLNTKFAPDCVAADTGGGEGQRGRDVNGSIATPESRSV